MKLLSGYDLRRLAILFRNEETGQTIVVRNSVGETFASIDFRRLQNEHGMDIGDLFTHSCEVDDETWQQLLEIAE
jgi:hypothetical protein